MPNITAEKAMLVSRATTPKGLFADLVRRAANNLGIGNIVEAGEQVVKMALRAQCHCRATLETLSAIKSLPVVYAKQANTAHGPQQVNNTLNATQNAGTPNAPNELLGAAKKTSADTQDLASAERTHAAVEKDLLDAGQ